MTHETVRHAHAGHADIFLVPLPDEGTVQVAVRHVETSGDAWTIYGAVSTTQTIQPGRREKVRQAVLAYVLRHPADVHETLLHEAQRAIKPA